MKRHVVEYIGRIKDAGAETLVKDYALLLDKNKFEVTVLCEDYEPDSANYRILKENGISVVTTYNIKLDVICRIMNRLFQSSFRSFLLRKKLKELKPDVLHVHLEELEDVKNCADLLSDCKIFYTCHNLPERMIGSERPREHEACEYLLKNNNLQITALHEEMKKEINELFNIDSTVVVNNGIDVLRFRDVSETKDDIRKSIGVASNAYVIGHIGRFMYQKNHEFLLDIFGEVAKLNDKAHLLLIGEGKLEKEIKDKINKLNLNEKVTILSKRKDIPELLKAVDVYLFPSRWEGLSVALLEAEASGRLCVVSDTINPESFESDDIVVLSLNEKPKEWAKACLKPVPNVGAGHNIENYDIRNVVKRLEKLYEGN